MKTGTKRRRAGIVVAVTALLVLASGAFTAMPVRASGHGIQNYASGMCLDDPGYSPYQGTQMQIWPCNGGSNQDWVAQLLDNYWYILRNSYSGLCLDDQGGSTQNGSHLIQYGCNTADTAQLFRWPYTTQHNGISYYGYYTYASSSTCIDDPGGSTTAGTKLQFYSCNGTGAQQWSWPTWY